MSATLTVYRDGHLLGRWESPGGHFHVLGGTMAKSATIERTTKVPTAAELERIVNMPSDDDIYRYGRAALVSQAKDRVTGVLRSAFSYATKVREIPPARWAINFVKAAVSKAMELLRTYNKRAWLAGVAAALLTPGGRRMLDKGVRFFGRTLFKLGRGITKPAAWVLRKVKLGKLANKVEFSPMIVRVALARQYDKGKAYLSDKLPLDHKATTFVGHLAASYFVGSTIGVVMRHTLPASWQLRVLTWLRKALVLNIALIGATPWLNQLTDKLDRFTKKVEKSADLLTTEKILGPRMVTKAEAHQLVVERTIALIDSPRAYATEDEMAADLVAHITAPLGAVYPRSAVERIVAGYSTATCPWAQEGSREEQAAALHEVLNREVADAMKDIPADAPAMTNGIVVEDPDPTVLTQVVEDLKAATANGQLPQRRPVPTPPAKRTPPAAKRQRQRAHAGKR